MSRKQPEGLPPVKQPSVAGTIGAATQPDIKEKEAAPEPSIRDKMPIGREERRKLPDLPFQHKYGGGEDYYARECYEEYYPLVEQFVLTQESCLTVAGTPDIGTSVFYAYCFEEFSLTSWRKIKTAKARRPKRKLRRYSSYVMAYPKRDAALVLDLGLDDAEIDSRVEVFGGTARFCLSRDTNKITLAKERLVELIIREIRDGAGLQGLLFEETTEDTRNSLLHLEPLWDQKRCATIKLAYSFVVRESTLLIAESNKTDEFDADTLSPSLVSSGPYHKPTTKKWESIDSLYLPKMNSAKPVRDRTAAKWSETNNGPLILFQMTILKSHPVNASELVYVLSKLEFLERLEHVKLVFVVPDTLVGQFKRQPIVLVTAVGTNS
ncbi:hypothetical protein PR003_g29121 [Phytophthora rubi]|uniref:Uncharacterized protein n=1 Tax=Phytophthora rubi TaxID=129364 RepID=A0A6A4BPM3_9STRA|nr:hypothetical protein PR003_g29121 [Phytophthora rubi]